jgi:hypothetical protein
MPGPCVESSSIDYDGKFPARVAASSTRQAQNVANSACTLQGPVHYVARVSTTVNDSFGGAWQAPFQIAILRLARSQVVAPAIVADHDVNVLR